MLQFSVANLAEQPQRIKRWRVSCDCLRLAPEDLELPPGAAATIVGVVDFRRDPDYVGGIGVHVEAVLDAGAIVPVAVLDVDVAAKPNPQGAAE